MNNKLSNIIREIDQKIEKIKNNSSEYKFIEREILKRVVNNKSLNKLSSSPELEFSSADLIFSSIIMDEKYDDIDDILKRMINVKKIINSLSTEGLFRLASSIETNDFINDDDKSLKFVSDIILLDNEQEKKKLALDFITIFKYTDINMIVIVGILKDIQEKKRRILKEFGVPVPLINCIYNIGEISKELNKINAYYLKLEKENDRIKKDSNKSLNKLQELRKILIDTEDVREITNIDEIVNLLTDDLKLDVLNYIEEKNNAYYKELENEYNLARKNSVATYINIFKEYNINFLAYNKEEQKQILDVDSMTLENILSFLSKIGCELNKNVIDTILGTDNNIVNQIDEYIKGGFLTSEFVKNNIDILKKDKYLLLIKNIETLVRYGINLVGLSNYNILLKDNNIIIDNLKLIDEYSINIKTRNLKNYSFLGSIDLEYQILSIKALGIDINENIELLNSDLNVIKRIKICKNIGLDIYDENGIKKVILNQRLFFIPDSKLDDYISKKTLKI